VLLSVFILYGPWGLKSGRVSEEVLLPVSRSLEPGELPLENKAGPAAGPEMRQLLVMSPHAFLGYEFSPAVAGREPSLLLLLLLLLPSALP